MVPEIDPRTQASFLWGLIGMLSFLVLVLGYALVFEPLVGPWAMLAVALGVGITATTVTYVGEGYLQAREWRG